MLDELRMKAVLFLHLFLQLFLHLWSQLVSIVDQESLLAFSCFVFLVVLTNGVDVNMQAHEASQTLLSKEPLKLQVALLNHFARKNIRLGQIRPFSNPKLLDCNFENLNFLWTPTG